MCRHADRPSCPASSGSARTAPAGADAQGAGVSPAALELQSACSIACSISLVRRTRMAPHRFRASERARKAGERWRATLSRRRMCGGGEGRPACGEARQEGRACSPLWVREVSRTSKLQGALTCLQLVRTRCEERRGARATFTVLCNTGQLNLKKGNQSFVWDWCHDGHPSATSP